VLVVVEQACVEVARGNNEFGKNVYCPLVDEGKRFTDFLIVVKTQSFL
jgi:hypothetical protein